MSNIQEKVDQWLNSPLTEAEKNEIRQMDQETLTEAFYKDLEFGTGGLRGVMGLGSNRMNRYTVGMATQGLANYLKKTYPGEAIRVAIAHDSRNNSRYFAETTAAVFSANDIEVYLFDSLRPTPELSFTIRHFKCHSGVVLTASHNPKEYNGYKAYWNDGAQLVAPHDKNVIAEVQAISSIGDIQFEAKKEKIHSIGEEIDALYLDEVKKLCFHPELKDKADVPIVYTPLHGTGIQLVPQALKSLGFENIHIVEEQSKPDGNFPTVVYPNPEEAEALTLGLKKAKKENAELVMATDPDADRVGIAIKKPDGEFTLLNGNQTGALLFYYVLLQNKEKENLKSDDYVVKTIVTSDLLSDICKGFGVDCYETLTGFKHIASVIRKYEGKKRYIVGGEESYGYLIGDFVRDKDAISSCVLIAEMAAWAKSHGKSLWNLLMDVYAEFGCYQERLVSITKKGQAGAKAIEDMMAGFRSNPPKNLARSPVTKLLDYDSLEAQNLENGETTKIDLPKSNVLQFYTADGSKVSARPSGTEPKIKFYFSVNFPMKEAADFPKVNQALQEKIDQLIQDLGL